MKRSLAAVGLSVLLACSGGGMPGPTPPPPTPGPDPSPSPVPSGAYDCENPAALTGIVESDSFTGRYIVVLKRAGVSRLDRQEIHTLARAMGGTNVEELPLINGFVTDVPPGGFSTLAADPRVDYIQQEGVKSINLGSWGLDRVDQRDLPLDDVFEPGADGSGVHIAIVDTGITDVPDFEGRLSSDCFSSVSGGCADGHGHGTHVSGTAAGKLYGIAKKATLYASRVLNASGSGTDSQVIQGIQWVAQKKQEDPSKDWVANMSLGGSPAPALDKAVCNAIAAGVTFAIAAGNESRNGTTSSPARVFQAITVGATDSSDVRASFSNYGQILDTFAPGVSITSDQPGGGTATWNGTSMATPHVTGAVALYLQRHPGSTPAQVAEGLLGLASSGKLSSIGNGSPNLLLYVRAQ